MAQPILQTPPAPTSAGPTSPAAVPQTAYAAAAAAASKRAKEGPSGTETLTVTAPMMARQIRHSG